MATCAKCGTHFFQLFEDAGPLCPRCLATEVSLQPVRVTPILVGLIAVVYVAMVASGVSPTDPKTDALIAWGSDFGPLTLRGEPWRLVSSMFLHAGILHLVFNAWALWTLGRLTERLLGALSFALIYLLSGIAGDLASLLIHPLLVSVGASGAIFGAAGALGSLQYLRKLPATALVLRRDLAGIGTFVVYNLVYGATHGGIDNAAHVGGLLTGLALAAFVPLPVAPGEPRPRGRTVATFGLASALLALGGAYVWHVRAPVAELGSGLQLMDAGRTDAAIQALEHIVTRWPNEAEAHFVLGAAYLQANRLDEGAGSLRQATRLDSLNPSFANELGVAYLRTNRLDSAIVIFKKAIALAPKWSYPQSNLGLAYLRAGRAAEAIPPLRTALELQPNDANDQLMLGNAYLATQVFAQAVTSFDAALAHAKDSARVYGRRGVAYRFMHRDEDARADFERAVSLGTRRVEDSDVVADARRGLTELGASMPHRESRMPGNEVFLDALVDVKPAVVSFPSPEYPERLRVAKIGGRVLVQCVVDTSGLAEPRSVRILQSPDTAFSRAATTALLRARFRPARLNGRAVRVLIQLPLDFNIKSE